MTTNYSVMNPIAKARTELCDFLWSYADDHADDSSRRVIGVLQSQPNLEQRVICGAYVLRMGN